MKMKKLVLLLAALMLVLMASVVSAEVEYEVIAPDGYKSLSHRIPVVFVMPENGYDNDENNVIAGMLKTVMKEDDKLDMLIVLPSFEKNDNLHEEMKEIVSELESSEEYKNVLLTGAKNRAVIGTGTGGYMAYAIGMLNQNKEVESNADFGFVASIDGNLLDHEWYAVYGDLYEKFSADYAQNKDKNFGGCFTYLDAPVGGKMTNLAGSSADMGSLFDSIGLGSDKTEYTLRRIEDNETLADFQKESVKRVHDRFANKVVSGLARGYASMEKSALIASEPSGKLSYEVQISKLENILRAEEAQTQVDVIVTLVNPETGAALHEKIVDSADVGAAGSNISGVYSVPNTVKGDYSRVVLSAEIMGMRVELVNAYLIRSTKSTSTSINLLGDWHFKFTGRTTKLDMGTLSESEFGGWALSQPGFEWWSANFADLFSTMKTNPAIQQELAAILNMPSYYVPYILTPDLVGYLAIGNAYYARTFDVPADFAKEEIMLSVGRMDDRCEVYINGIRVGGTGITEDGASTGESAWEAYSAFPVPSSVLNYGGKNTIVVRDINDGLGGGGWYAGPIGLYAGEAFNEINPDGSNDYFYEETFESEYAAKLLGKPSPYDNPYLIYLPEDYYETERYYPTVYLLHQYNSTHTSYRTDSVDEILNEGVKEGLFDEFIVVIPNSQEESWWYGDWQKMITEELIPHIDANYRTIDDARYRFTAGCSMGGQGAMAVALQNPNEFSGALSFFGAFSFGGNASPNYIAENESAEYLDNFALYFICGNQDIYSFGVPAIQLNQQLEKMGVDHYFFIENGEHDSKFYLPQFKTAFEYVWKNMYDDAVLEGGNPKLENQKPNLRTMAFAELLATDEGVVPVFAVNDKIAQYYNLIPDSSYTVNPTPDLSIPLRITITQNGQKYQALLRDHKIAQGVNVNVLDALTGEDLVLMSRSAATFDPAQKFTYTIEAAIFDNNWVKLDPIPDDLLGGVDLPDTGDNSNAALFVLLLAASVGMLGVLAIRKRRA